MKIRLYVYTGTGNSLWVARQLASELKEATLEFMPSLTKDFKVEADGVGIIFPVHIWGLPIRVIRFIEHLQVKPETYFFALAVNAGQPAATLVQMNKLMSARELSLATGFSLVLPSNYIPWGGPGPVATQQRRYREAQEKVKAIAGLVHRGERKKVDKGPLWQNILFSLFYRMSFPYVYRLDKNFWVDDKCNSCGICAQVCPAQNVEMSNGKPAWYHRCEQCLACLQWCPQEAIQYGKKPSATRGIIIRKSSYGICSNKRKPIKTPRPFRGKDIQSVGLRGVMSRNTNTNEISKVSLRGAERRSNPKKDEIATPFGLAMTSKDNNCVCNNNS